jgi:hypothetical protein
MPSPAQFRLTAAAWNNVEDADMFRSRVFVDVAKRMASSGALFHSGWRDGNSQGSDWGSNVESAV